MEIHKTYGYRIEWDNSQLVSISFTIYTFCE